MSLPDEAYSRLLALRSGLRHFERWSEQQAQAAGLTPAQHQLLLAVKGHGDLPAPTIGEVADYLLLRHHSTVGLVDRAEAANLISRRRDEEDHRVVRLYLTPTGAERLEALSALHLEELDRLAVDLPAAWKGLGPLQRLHGFPGLPPGGHGSSSQAARSGTGKTTTVALGEAAGADGQGQRPSQAVSVEVVRAYGTNTATGHHVLVDRLWPRGINKQDAPFDEWCKDVAPSPELRKWYGHTPERFEAFAHRYRAELEQSPGREAVEALRSKSGAGNLVLVTATKDVQRSSAEVLRAVITDR